MSGRGKKEHSVDHVATCVIACGALAHELVALQRLNDWNHLKIQCLPASLHNRPEKIPDAIRAEIEDKRDHFERIFVAYADCGTGGKIDEVLNDYGIARLSGAHCYEFFAGSAAFNRMADDEAGTFYLTDFLTRHFEHLVIRGLGLDKNPELKPAYFRNYKRLLYLSQTDNAELQAMARSHADFLGLDFEHVHTGLDNIAGEFEDKVIQRYD